MTFDVASEGSGASAVEVPAKVAAQPNEMLVAPVKLAPAADPVASIRLTLNFDPAVVELVNVRKSDPAAAYEISVVQDANGVISIEVTGLDAASADLASIVDFEFRVRDDAVPGSQAAMRLETEVLETAASLAAKAAAAGNNPEDENP